MRPYVGASVLFRSELSEDVTEHPAVITRVYSDQKVNLMVFFNGRHPEKRMDVTVNPNLQDNAANVWRWPSVVPQLINTAEINEEPVLPVEPVELPNPASTELVQNKFESNDLNTGNDSKDEILKRLSELNPPPIALKELKDRKDETGQALNIEPEKKDGAVNN